MSPHNRGFIGNRNRLSGIITDPRSDTLPDLPPMMGDAPGAAPAGQPASNIPVWLYPPVSWLNLDQIAYALLPAIGSIATIVSFTVPIGYNGVIQKVACNFVGGGWVEGSGDVIWQILVDGAPPPGATSYSSIAASLGSPANPVGIAGFRVMENQVLSLVALNNPAGPSGGIVVAGQRVGGRLVGYLYPREMDDDGVWV